MPPYCLGVDNRLVEEYGFVSAGLHSLTDRTSIRSQQALEHSQTVPHLPLINHYQ